MAIEWKRNKHDPWNPSRETYSLTILGWFTIATVTGKRAYNDQMTWDVEVLDNNLTNFDNKAFAMRMALLIAEARLDNTLAEIKSLLDKGE